MINLNLKYNTDDEKSKKNGIKGIGNKNCWIKTLISALVVD